MALTDNETARRLKERGFPWLPQRGDCFVSGISGLVFLYEGQPTREADLFLPRLDDLLKWLAEQGYDYHLQRNDPSRRTWLEPVEFRVELSYPGRLGRPVYIPPFYGDSPLEATVAAVFWRLTHH